MSPDGGFLPPFFLFVLDIRACMLARELLEKGTSGTFAMLLPPPPLKGCVCVCVLLLS